MQVTSTKVGININVVWDQIGPCHQMVMVVDHNRNQLNPLPPTNTNNGFVVKYTSSEITKHSNNKKVKWYQ